MEDQRCSIVAMAMDDQGSSSFFNNSGAELEDMRYTRLYPQDDLEVEDGRCNNVQMEMEDPRCHSFASKW